MLTDVPGIRVGHASDPDHLTGCTVILCPEGTTGSGDIRGPAPGSREAALLSPEKPVQFVNAVVFTGGSAFGLGTADGVMKYLEEQGSGHWTPFARVPIVPTAVVYDLFMSRGISRPNAAMGYDACMNARSENVMEGNVGAGSGVTVGKWAGFENMMKGGFGMASVKIDIPGENHSQKLVVAAGAVTNCVGDVLDKKGEVLAGALGPGGTGWMVESNPMRQFPQRPPAALTNTTLVVVATNAILTKVEVYRLAQRAHDGMAVAIRPAHTTHDGDTAFALATSEVESGFDLVANAADEVVAGAIRRSVLMAKTVGKIKGLAG